jgi:hypothetical protein
MDPLVQTVFWVTFALLLGILTLELLPQRITEGFQELINVGDSKLWANLVPRRGDVGPEQEMDGLVRNTRYFAGYVDMQRFGVKSDFCRFVQKGSDEKDMFLACALGGTENLSSTSFRSPSVRDGFVLSRDDYMRDVDDDGRDDYCRIVKEGMDFISMCNPSTDKEIRGKMVPDNSPPDDIKMLLTFYAGCVFWLRFRDDMVDYAQNLYINSSGDAAVQEKPPRPDATEGLVLNGVNQFVRIGDDPYLNFGSVVQLRQIKAWHFWVRFDEFTNNAHIFDFGNGAGIDNVWVGILNRGNLGVDTDGGNSVVPDAPSGAQPEKEMSPQELMKTTDANVEEFTCEGFAVAPRKMPRTIPKGLKKDGEAKTADMCYEIWDKDQRKMRIVIPNMFRKGEWTHVVITAEGTDAFRPNIAIYRNGVKKFLEPSGWLPQNSLTEKNYIGRSNWTNVTSQYANKDELLKGAVFDVRAYNVPLAQGVIKNSYGWGRKYLGLDA